MKREKDVERGLVKDIEARGGLCEKFVSPGRRDVPDRIVIEGGGLDAAATWLHHQVQNGALRTVADCRDAVREVLCSVIYFVECKAPGKKPTKRQARDHKKRRELGITVHVYDGEWHAQ